MTRISTSVCVFDTDPAIYAALQPLLHESVGDSGAHWLSLKDDSASIVFFKRDEPSTDSLTDELDAEMDEAAAAFSEKVPAATVEGDALLHRMTGGGAIRRAGDGRRLDVLAAARERGLSESSVK